MPRFACEVWWLVALFWASGVQPNAAEYTLTIVHLNDFHARVEETSVLSGRCSPADVQSNCCYGGFARVSSKLEEIRRSEPNVLYMAAGDYYQGTVWYSIHKWKPFAYFLNLLRQDVMSLGNHEFDDGVAGLSPFLDNVTFPVLAANVDLSLEPSLVGKILPSVVLSKGGRQIGIVGYITTATKIISNTEKVIFLDEIESVRQESSRLRQQGVDIIIALGHAGYKVDQEIAAQVEDLDIVVGGHTNTFLFTGKQPSTEEIVAEYPTVVTQKSGRQVPVVTAYAFGKYLGFFQVNFDDKGEVLQWSGNPILLDNTVPKDPRILKELEPWKKEVEAVKTDTIGRTFVFVDGHRSHCRIKECNMGNLIADAMVHQNAKYPDDKKWALTSLAVMNSGGIRSSFDETTANGSITMEDVLTVCPFRNTIDLVELKGRHVRQMFEQAVKDYDPKGIDPPGGFLQVSGFHIVYDISRPSGSRVVRLEARCVECRVPELKEVEDETVYAIAMTSFTASGGDGLSAVRDNKIRTHLTGLLDTDIMNQYVRLYTPLYPGIEKRIVFKDSSKPCKEGYNDNPHRCSYETLSGLVKRTASTNSSARSGHGLLGFTFSGVLLFLILSRMA